MLDVAKQAVEAARAAGADYADGRVVADNTESLTVRNQEMEGIDRSTSEGVGIRVLVNGYWGFAATARQEPEEIDRTARLAVEIAKAAARLPMEPVVLAPIEPVTGTWHSPMQVDPFNIPLEEKVAMLMEATRRMQSVEGLAFAEGGIDLFRRRTFLATSESRRPSSRGRGSRRPRWATASSSAARSRTRSVATSRPPAGSTSSSSA